MQNCLALLAATLFALVTLRLAAQTPLPDSLHLTGMMADTMVANRLMDEAKAQMYTAAPDLTLEKLGQAQTILKYTVGEEVFAFSGCLYYVGYVYFAKRDFEQANLNWQRALRIYQNTVGDHGRTAKLLSLIGTNYLVVANDPDGAIPYFQQSIEMTERLDWPYFDPYHNIALAYNEKDDEPNTLYYLEKALERAKKFLKPTDIDLSNRYQQAAIGCSNLGDYDRALGYLHSALGIAQKNLPDTVPFVIQIFCQIGSLCNETGDYDRALEYYQKALSGQQATRDTIGITGSLSEMGRAYTAKSDYDHAMSVFQQAQKFVDQYPMELEASGYYLYVGQALSAQGKMQQAIEQFHKALSITMEIEGDSSFELVAPLASIAKAHTLAGEYQAANLYYERLMAICEKYPLLEHPYMAVAFNEYADCLQRQNKFQQADSLYHRAWTYFQYTGTNSLSQVRGLNYLLPSIYERGNFYRRWYQHTGHVALLDQSLRIFEAFDEAVLYQRLRLSTGSKTALSKGVLPGYEGAIATYLLRWRESGDTTALCRAFGFSEKARSFQLFEALRETKARQFAGIPDSLLQREHDLSVDLAYQEKRRNELVFDQKKTEMDATVLSLNGRIADFRHQYESLQRRFEQDYPDYYRLRYDLSTASTSYVQRTLLQPDQALLEYFVGDSSIYLFVLRSDTLLAEEIKRDFPLDSLVAQMREGLLGGGEYENTDRRYWLAVDQYTTAAQELYRRFVAPVRGVLGSRLVIVPDGSLTILPFEALLTAPQPEVGSRFGQYPYLLREHAVSYAYSATLLREMQAHRTPKGPSFSKKSILLAMAPFSQMGYAALQPATREVVNPKTLNALPATGKEILGVNQIWGSTGTVLLDRKATKSVFERTASQYKILHLATHGKADYRSGDYSYIVFAAQKDTLALLHVRDIYNLSLHADLVVLSACETGMGRLQSGEGVVSLARAFSYAGARSIVTTFWPVHDEGTKNLMVQFHRQLKGGHKKDVALQKAKFSLLKDPSTNHPFFWAGFWVIGDVERIGL